MGLFLFRKPFLISFTLLYGLATPAFATLIDRIMVIVNSDTILHSDIGVFYRTARLRREIDPFMMLTDGMDAERPSRANVIEYLIQERMIAQQIKVQDTEVEAKITDVMRSNQLDRKGLDEFLRSKGFNYKDYSDLMRVSLQKQNLLDRDIRARVNISDDDIRNHYFNTLSKASGAPLEYSVQMIVVTTKNYKNPKFAQDAAQNSLKSITEGEPFSDVAKRSSDDASATNGGDIGFIAADQISPALKDAIKGLKIGEVSRVIQNGDAFYIVKLNDIRSLHNEKLELEKERLRELLAKVEYRRQLVLWTERMKSLAYIKINQ